MDEGCVNTLQFFIVLPTCGLFRLEELKLNEWWAEMSQVLYFDQES